MGVSKEADRNVLNGFKGEQDAFLKQKGTGNLLEELL
jgi:hypothetical protein